MRKPTRVVQFTPGRASYATDLGDGKIGLELTPAAQKRAGVADADFDSVTSLRYAYALFAGGHPGVAQRWPENHIPPLGKREANLMAIPLQNRLARMGLAQAEVDTLVRTQGNSDNSLGDVGWSIRMGLLKIDDFHDEDDPMGIRLVAGGLHGHRFARILGRALDLAPGQLQRIPMRDIYGTERTDFRGPESAPVAIAKELGAIVLTERVLGDIIPGDVNSVFEAEDHFKHLAHAA